MTKSNNITVPPLSFAALSAILGIVIAANLNQDNQNTIGNFLQGLGQVMLIIAAQSQNIQNCTEQEGNKEENESSEKLYLQEQITLLKEQLSLLEKKLDKV